MVLSRMKQGNNMINERPGRVCVVEVSAACQKMAQGVKVVMNIWLWWLFLTGGIIFECFVLIGFS